MIQELKNEPDTPLNRYLLQQYTHMPKMEPNLTRWDDWIDINHSMLPLLIGFVIYWAPPASTVTSTQAKCMVRYLQPKTAEANYFGAS